MFLSLELDLQTVAAGGAAGTELGGDEDLETIRPEVKEKLCIDVRTQRSGERAVLRGGYPSGKNPSKSSLSKVLSGQWGRPS